MKIGSMNQSSDQISTFQHLFQNIFQMYGFIFLTASQLKVLQMTTRSIIKHSLNLSTSIETFYLNWSQSILIFYFIQVSNLSLTLISVLHAGNLGLIFYCFIQFMLCFMANTRNEQKLCLIFFVYFLWSSFLTKKIRFVTSYQSKQPRRFRKYGIRRTQTT